MLDAVTSASATKAIDSRPVVIDVANLGIRYRRYCRKPFTLKEAAVSFFRKTTEYETFWALREVSFALRRGDTLGVIGPNGSGKSTLLKALAGLLPPAEGQVKSSGRVAPVIELGGGFNPQLTGRENIYLNGAIMGLTRKQTSSKLDSIMDFAELGDFIDSPLRTYSSGMRARLGFAIATDINPEILLLDEVFSVGDLAFRAKASRRIEGFFGTTKAVVLVSHSLDLIRRLCSQTLYLRNGRAVAMGETNDVIGAYEEDVRRSTEATRS